MDSYSYRAVCRRYGNFWWWICCSPLVTGALRIEHNTLSWIGFATAIMIASVVAVLQAVDGIALKMAVDSWATAPAEKKDIILRVAEGIRWLEYGTNSIFRILQGSVAAIFGVAIVKSVLLSRWISGGGSSCRCYQHYCRYRGSLYRFWIY